MPLLDIQRRGRQIGEIRLGIAVKDSNGKSRPSKLDSLRFTTKSASIAGRVAELLGGQMRPVQLQNGTNTFEVVTDVTEVPVMVPPGDNVISQWYEMWTAAGCSRRCDSVTEQVSQTPCKCPNDPKARAEQAKSGSACKPITRVNLMLPDLPDLGVWLLSSTGFNAANEMGGAAEVLAAARDSGVIIPAKLRLEQREKRVVGKPTNKFVVPILEMEASLRQMTELQRGDIAASLPPAPTLAIGAGARPQIHDEVIEAELVADDDLGRLIAQLGQEQQSELTKRMQERHFPDLDKLPAAAEGQVRRWINELANDPGREF